LCPQQSLIGISLWWVSAFKLGHCLDCGHSDAIFAHFLGSIFTSDKDESEIAFRTAVDRANILERSIELVPIVMYANTDDSFIMEKMGKNKKVPLKIFKPFIKLYFSLQFDFSRSNCNFWTQYGQQFWQVLNN